MLAAVAGRLATTGRRLTGGESRFGKKFGGIGGNSPGGGGAHLAYPASALACP